MLSFSIRFLNIQGLTQNKLNEVDLFLEEYGMFYIICMTEHWLDADGCDVFHHEGWHVASNFSRMNYQRGGSLVLNKDLNYEVLSWINSCSIKKRIIINVYRPLGAHYEVFLNTPKHILNNLISTRVVLTGDFNCRAKCGCSEADSTASDLCDLLNTFG